MFNSFIINKKILIISGELELWFKFWNKNIGVWSEDQFPSTAIDALGKCDPNIFPTVYQLLSIVCTLPMSVATAERSFSTLRRVKTWLRSRMQEDRLTSLCLLNVHREVEISIDQIIDRFGKSDNVKRRLDFVIYYYLFIYLLTGWALFNSLHNTIIHNLK